METAERSMTCISCPMGCELSITEKKDGIVVTGNKCERGAAYAKSEITNPIRMITSTVRLTNGSFMPVKTSKGVPKNKVFAVINELKTVVISPPVSMNQIIVKNILNLGTDVVSTSATE